MLSALRGLSVAGSTSCAQNSRASRKLKIAAGEFAAFAHLLEVVTAAMRLPFTACHFLHYFGVVMSVPAATTSPAASLASLVKVWTTLPAASIACSCEAVPQSQVWRFDLRHFPPRFNLLMFLESASPSTPA